MLKELSTAQKVVAVTGRVEDACASVPVERNFTMAQLGSAAGIAVGAAVVTLLNG